MALAADSGSDEHAREVFQSLAATATLLRERRRGTAKAGEAIILAIG